MDGHDNKDSFDMFTPEFYQDEFAFMFNGSNPDTIPFNSLNISGSVNEYYPATIAPSALTSSPHDFRRSDSPDATIVGPRNPVTNGSAYPVHPIAPQPQPLSHRDSSSSPSSSDAFHGNLPLPHVVPASAAAAMGAHHILPLHHNLSTTSLSSSGAEVGRPRSSRASPPLSSRDSPNLKGRSATLANSPKRNGGGLVHRHSRTNSASSRPARRGSTRKVKEEDDFSDFEEDDDFAPHAASDGKPERRREDIRKQRIESEQRRRDELREGYNRLKSALPPSNQKSSKASILERATVCITDLNQKSSVLSSRVDELETELRRVRVLNETLMLSAAEHRSAAAAATFAAAQAGVHLPVGFQQS